MPTAVIQTTFATPGNFTRYESGSDAAVEVRPVEEVVGLPPMVLVVYGTDVDDQTQVASVSGGQLVLQPPAFGPSDSQRVTVSLMPEATFQIGLSGTYGGSWDDFPTTAPPFNLFPVPSAVTIESATATAYTLEFAPADGDEFGFLAQVGEVDEFTLAVAGTNVTRPSPFWLPNIVSIGAGRMITLANTSGGAVVVDGSSASISNKLGPLKRVTTSNVEPYTPTYVSPFKISFAPIVIEQFWTGFVGTYEVL